MEIINPMMAALLSNPVHNALVMSPTYLLSQNPVQQAMVQSMQFMEALSPTRNQVAMTTFMIAHAQKPKIDIEIEIGELIISSS